MLVFDRNRFRESILTAQFSPISPSPCDQFLRNDPAVCNVYEFSPQLPTQQEQQSTDYHGYWLPANNFLRDINFKRKRDIIAPFIIQNAKGNLYAQLVATTTRYRTD